MAILQFRALEKCVVLIAAVVWFPGRQSFFEGVDALIEVDVGTLQPVHAREVATREAFEAAQDFGLHVAHGLKHPVFDLD